MNMNTEPQSQKRRGRPPGSKKNSRRTTQAAACPSWQFGPIGLGLVGPSGIGKTRCAFTLLRRMFDAGKTIAAVCAPKFAKICAEQFDGYPDTREQSKRALGAFMRAEILFLDDLGKARFTERVEIELFDLLEYRTGHPFHFEVKAVEKLNLEAACNQAERDSRGEKPWIVAHRRNRGPWRVTMSAETFFDPCRQAGK